MSVINPDFASVFDEGEIYILDPAYTGTLAAAEPAPGEAPGSMWLDFGLLDPAGVTYTPGLEKNFYDGWGHPRFKGKTSKGTLELSFSAFELNAVTDSVVNGDDAGYISVPKGVHRHLLIITREDDVEEIEVTRRPALLTTGEWTKSEAGVRTYPITADIFPDADKHLLKLIKSGGAVTRTVTVSGSPTGGTFTLTVNGQTTTGIAYNAAVSVVQTAVAALSTVGAGNVTVTGTAGAYTVVLKNGGTLTASGASLTPSGTVTVS